MLNSRIQQALLIALGVAVAGGASAQQSAQGFAVERFYPSSPGAGWLVMDSLDMRGGLGGALSLNIDFAKNPLHIEEGAKSLSVVSDLALADFGAAITYDRFRFSLNLATPIAVLGHSGVIRGRAYEAPVVDLSTRTDAIGDVRLGAVARLFGEPTGALRVGVGAQLYFPNGQREDELSDGTYRAMFRLHIAGDTTRLTYAGHLGLHVRPLDDPDTVGAPRGSELLYGAAGGVKVSIPGGRGWRAVFGPELFGVSALHGDTDTSAVEGLLSARLEGTQPNAMQTRIKLGLGGGLTHAFGAPDVRVVLAAEVFSSHE